MAILPQDQFDQQVLNLVNQYRAQNGLSALILSQELDQAADKYANRMATGDFFSHTDPNGSTPFTRMRAEGYQYTTAGENIAAGYATPESVVQGWINSPGHRANILNANYKHMGIGYAYLANDTGSVNYRHYWVQTFGAGDSNYGVYGAETTGVLPVITIAATDANAAETNAGQTANPGRFTLTRTGSTTAALTVNYAITGSAVKGTDYNNLAGTATFAAGSTTALVDINPVNDTTVESAETVILTLANNSAYQVGTTNTATVTIVDNDVALPTITIAATDANAAETNAGQTANPGRFTLTRTGSTTAALTVNYAITGSAVKGTDYNNLAGTATFAAGSTTALVDINPVNDTTVESAETVILTLANNSAYQVGTAKTATVTIVDNDTNPITLNGDAKDNVINVSTAPSPNKYSIFGLGGNDKICASSQNDSIEGGDGNDILGGFRGNDIIRGGNGNDTIVGYRYSDLAASGDGEVDTLTGGSGADLFILSYQNAGKLYIPYQSNTDNADYALITDFKIAEGDRIQLVQPTNSVSPGYAYQLKAAPTGLPTGTAIYAGSSANSLGLIAIVQGDVLSYGLYTGNAPAPTGITYTQTSYSDF